MNVLAVGFAGVLHPLWAYEAVCCVSCAHPLQFGRSLHSEHWADNPKKLSNQRSLVKFSQTSRQFENPHRLGHGPNFALHANNAY